MSAYEKFAQVYDLFMDNIDYEGWAEYVTDRLREYEITDGLVLELGCGTGTMTGLLAGKSNGKKSRIRTGYSVSSAGYAGI